MPSPQAADAAALTGGDFSLVPTDKDSQRALRIRWVGQNPEDCPEDHPIGQSWNPQDIMCIGDVRSNSDVDDDDFRTNRTEDVRRSGDPLNVPFGSSSSSAGTVLSDTRSRFVLLSTPLVI